MLSNLTEQQEKNPEFQVILNIIYKYITYYLYKNIHYLLSITFLNIYTFEKWTK